MWWAGSGLVITLFPLTRYSGFAPLAIAGSALLLTVLATATAAVTALAVSLYRSNPHPGVGLGHALVLLVAATMVAVVPLAAAARQNDQVLLSLLGYFLWLGPSLLLIFRKPQAAHMTSLQFRMARLQAEEVAAAADAAEPAVAPDSARATEPAVASRRAGSTGPPPNAF